LQEKVPINAGRRESLMEKKIKALIQQALDDTMSSREFYLTMADLVERPDARETLRYLANRLK